MSKPRRVPDKGDVPVAIVAERLSASRPIPRRGLSRVESAIYLGISPTLFDEFRREGLIPAPRLARTRKLWDVLELDGVFNELPRDGGDSGWEDFRQGDDDGDAGTQVRQALPRSSS